MSSPDSKKKNDEEDSSELQLAMRELVIHPPTMQDLIVHRSTILLLNMCLQPPRDNIRVQRFRLTIAHQMESFMRNFLRQPAHILSPISVIKAAILNLQCAHSYAQWIELVVIGNRRVQDGGGATSSHLKWTLSKEYLRMVDDIHTNRIDNSLSLSSHLNKDSVIQGLGAIDTKLDFEVENILNPNKHKMSLQELQKRVADLRRRLDEPCSSEMAFKLQQELNEILMHQEDWQHKEIDNLKSPDNEIHELSQTLYDDYPKADQSNDQKNDGLSFPLLAESDATDLSSDEFDDTFAFDSGMVSNDMTTDNVELDKSIKLEQQNYTRFKQEVLRVCYNRGGAITMANVMENKCSCSVAQFFMASLMLASEKKLQLQNKGQKAKPTTIDHLVLKSIRKS